ncbi:DMT family transporter [Rhodobacteraceae bacterium LMO-12]|nr:DMT family transporter [Rhodobacteraceae bacterium LMO-JJ12]
MQSENTRGIALMIVAMVLFAATDACVKLGAEAMPKGQVLFFLGLGGAVIFSALTWAQGHRVITRDYLSPAMLLRNGSDVLGTFCFLTALSTVGIALPSAILQATPLVVTGLAVIMLGEKVGWRRWGAILIGLSGVLIILRPGMTGFDPNALWAVAGMLFLAVRDVSTRLMPPSTPSIRIAAYGMGSLLPAGAIITMFQGGPVAMSLHSGILMLGATTLGALGYFCIIQAMRTGEISVVAPFRYSRILFALAIGYLVFDENPDVLTYVGAAITIGAGTYAFLREGRIAHKRPV